MPQRPRRPSLPAPRGALARRLGGLDQRALRFLRTRGHDRRSERIAAALGRFGEWGLGWTAIGAVGAAVDGRRRREWCSAAAVGPAAVGINYGVKLAVGRERPLIEDHPMLGRAPSKLSFPSAHATSSVAAATATGRLWPAARPALYGLAAAICLGRPFLGMHYPSDVLAGVVLGRAIGRTWPLPAPGVAAGEGSAG